MRMGETGGREGVRTRASRALQATKRILDYRHNFTQILITRVFGVEETSVGISALFFLFL